MKKIGYVILTWNSEKYIQKCLDSILNLNHYQQHIIVIDNGSKDNTISILKTYKTLKTNHQLDVIFLPENIGTTKSRNMGIKTLNDVDYICILDSDTVVNEKAIDQLILALEDPNIAIIGPELKTSANVIQNSGRRFPTLKIKFYKGFPSKKLQKKGEQLENYDFSDKQRVYIVDYLMSACWFLRKEICDQIGLLDENIFYAPEDVEYCMRAHLLGYHVVFCPKCSIIHEWQRISKKKLISKMNYVHIKGLLYYFKKYHYIVNADKARGVKQ